MAVSYLGLFLISLSSAFSAPPTTVTRVSDYLHNGDGGPFQSAFSPDGRYFCFMSNIAQASVSDLWCTRTDEPGFAERAHDQTLLGPLRFSANDDFLSMPFTSDSSGVYFGTTRAVYRANLASRTAVLLSASPSLNVEILEWFIDEPSEHLIYTTVAFADLDIIAVPLDSPGQLIPLTDTVADFKSISDVRVSPDGTRVFFLGQLQGEAVALFTSTLAGNGLQKLSITDPVEDYVIAPDGSHVAFRVNSKLYGVPATGGSVQALSEPTFNNSAVLPPYEVLPDSSGVIYFGNEDADSVIELKRVSFAGGIPTVLDAVALTGLFFDQLISLTPNGDRLFYYVQLGPPFPQTTTLRALALDGPSVPTDIANSFIQSTDAYRYFAADDVLVHREQTGISSALYAQPADGSSQTTLFLGDDTESVQILGYSANLGRVIYSRQPNPSSARRQVFSVVRDGTGEVALTPDVDTAFYTGLFLGGFLYEREMSSDGRYWISLETSRIPNILAGTTRNVTRIRRSDLETGKSRSLASLSHIEGQGIQTKISFAYASDVDPDIVVFYANTEAESQTELFLLRFNRDVFADGFDPP